MKNFKIITAVAASIVSSQVLASDRVSTDPGFYTLPEAYWAQSVDLAKAPADKVSEEAKQLNQVLNDLQGKRSNQTIDYGRWQLKSTVNLNQVESAHVNNVNYCYAYLAKPLSSIRVVTKSEKAFRKVIYNKCSVMAEEFFATPEFDTNKLANPDPELSSRKVKILGYQERDSYADLLVAYSKQMVFKRMTVELKKKPSGLTYLDAQSTSFRMHDSSNKPVKVLKEESDQRKDTKAVEAMEWIDEE